MPLQDARRRAQKPAASPGRQRPQRDWAARWFVL